MDRKNNKHAGNLQHNVKNTSKLENMRCFPGVHKEFAIEI